MKRKGGLRDRFRGLAWDKLPDAHCLEFGRHVHVKEELREEEGSRVGCSPEEEHTPGPLSCLRFVSSQGRVSENRNQPSRCALSGSWSPLIAQGVISHCGWPWGHPPGFAAFLGPELKYSWGSDVTSRERRPRQKRLPWGRVLSWWQSAPGCRLLVSVFSRLSQLPYSYSTWQGIFVSSYAVLKVGIWKRKETWNNQRERKRGT